MPSFTPIADTSGSALVPLEQIPEDVQNEVEEAYAYLQKNGGRMRVTFESDEEAAEWFKYAVSYGAARPTGAVRFRRSPTRNLPDNVFDFRVHDDLPENGKRKGKTKD